MKWSVAGLVILGLIAALSASLLMALFSTQRGGNTVVRGDGEGTVLVAAHDIAAMTLVDASAVELKKVPRAKIADTAMTTTVEAIGKIVAVPMKAGQQFDKDSFVTEGHQKLAASLTDGKRAVAISLTDYAGLDGVLYPGSIVDVILTVNGTGNAKPSVSRVVLEAVQVLAIERQTIVAKDAEKQVDATDRRGQNARRVTLLVNSRQAAELMLASSAGSMSLALRNPLDKQAADRSLVSLTSLMPSHDMGSNFLKAMAEAAASPTTGTPVATAAPKEGSQTVHRNNWETTVIRGSASETLEFPPEPSDKEGI